MLFNETSDFRRQLVIAFTQEAVFAYGADNVLQEGYSSGGVLFHPGPHHFGHGVPFLGEEELFGRVAVAEGFHQATVAAAVYAPFVVVGMEVGGFEKRQDSGAVGARIDVAGLLAVEFVSRLGEHGRPCVAGVHLVAATGGVDAIPPEDQRYGPVILMLHPRFRDGDRGHWEAAQLQSVGEVLLREVVDRHKVPFRGLRFRFAAHDDGGVVCGAGVIFIGYLHFVGVAEFFLHPFFEFGFGESFLVSADGAVGTQHEDFGGVVESTAGLSFFALVYDAFCPADVDKHFAAGFEPDRHVLQHVAAPVFGQDVEDGVADDVVILFVYVGV